MALMNTSNPRANSATPPEFLDSALPAGVLGHGRRVMTAELYFPTPLNGMLGYQGCPYD